MEDITIYHNPQCGTSRNTLAMIRHAGLEPRIIHYLETPPDQKELSQLLEDMQLSPRQLLRTNVPPYQELGLDQGDWTDEELIGAMVKEPILINRPIVVSRLGSKLCRPSELLLDILPVALPSSFVKEDGQVVEPKPITSSLNGKKVENI